MVKWRGVLLIVRFGFSFGWLVVLVCSFSLCVLSTQSSVWVPLNMCINACRSYRLTSSSPIALDLVVLRQGFLLNPEPTDLDGQCSTIYLSASAPNLIPRITNVPSCPTLYVGIEYLGSKNDNNINLNND